MYRFMKKLILAVTMVLATTLFAAPRTVAAEKKTTTKTTVTSSSSYSESKMHVGIGFTTFGAATPVGAAGAVSFMLEFSDLLSLQPFFTFNSSSPFSFAVGSVLRYTLHGGNDNGFHGGLGFNLGTAAAGGVAGGTAFFVNIFPVVGYHFSLGGHVSNLKLSFDVGPIFEVTPAFQFRAGPLNSLGGASLHYMF